MMDYQQVRKRVEEEDRVLKKIVIETGIGRDRDRNVSGPAYHDFYRSVTAEESKEGENRENHKKERA